MNDVTIGLDLAKHVFQVHGVDAAGSVILRRRLRRSEVLAFFERLPSALIGIAPRMPGDLLAAAQDHHLVDEAFHHDVPEVVGSRHRVVVRAVAHERGR